MPPELLRGIHDLKFTEPTPIQALSIPPALEGRDVLAGAETGSGKSAAFGLPILASLLKEPPGKSRALILAPTRELTEQIAAHLRKLAKHTSIRVAPVYGGVGFAPQAAAFARGDAIVVATPGRLLDHIERGTATLDAIRILVLDEADRMLDMGFLPSVHRILRRLPRKRQTLFFSATLPYAISALVREMLHDPARIELTAAPAPVETLKQTLYAVPQEQKTDLLVELLKSSDIYSAIAFTRTKSRASRLAAQLQKHRIETGLVHGDRSQAQRTHALENFKRGKYRVLVATDVAARGIDIAGLGHVINYDVPTPSGEYLHRVGRTARAKAAGDAITFVSSEEEPLIRSIEYLIGTRISRSKNPLFPEASTEAPKPRVIYRSRRRRR